MRHEYGTKTVVFDRQALKLDDIQRVTRPTRDATGISTLELQPARDVGGVVRQLRAAGWRPTARRIELDLQGDARCELTVWEKRGRLAVARQRRAWELLPGEVARAEHDRVALALDPARTKRTTRL